MRKIYKKLSTVIFCLLTFAFSISFAQPITQHLWNLQDADIHAVIAAIAKETGKNFIIDPRVHGHITIVSSKPIPGKAAYQVFLSALQILGYAAVPGKNVIKIVPDINARSMPTPLATDNNPGTGDELVVRVVPIRHVSSMQLVPVLRPLMSQWSNIAAYTPSNVVIISGRAANVNLIVKIIHQVDIASSNQIEIIALHHASSSKVVESLKSLQEANRSNGKESTIALASDDEGNKILMSGSTAERLRMRVLISELDSADSEMGGNTRVVHLNYLDAKKFAPILESIAHSAYADSSGNSKITQGTGGDNSSAIKADAETNSIIISAPTNTLRTLINVIKQLDKRPTQVLVEAVIAQVDESTMKQLGVMWGTNEESNSDTANNGSIDAELGFQSGIGIIRKGNIRVLISALMDSSSSDILSTPSIVVINNEKAQIKVGKNVGIQNRDYAATSSTSSDTSTPYTTFERKDVALSLQVTPHITPDNTIQLKLQQINDTLQNPTDPGDNPIINTNQIDTSVMVHNGDILVLGGLISHEQSDSNSKTPILGDLPIVGTLFNYKNKRLDKKNLMLFIRPIILRHGINSSQVTSERYNFMRNRQLLRRMGVDIITNVGETPLLQPLNKRVLHLPPPFIN